LSRSECIEANLLSSLSGETQLSKQEEEEEEKDYESFNNNP
jgi:hypothetical protein